MKKKAIGLISIFAICLIIAALCGCGQKGLKIAFFLYDKNDTFITELMGYINVPEGMTIEICDAGNSQAVQNQQIVGLIDDGFDLFVINAVDRLACSSIIEKCTKEGMPLIFFNREPLEDALTGSNIFCVGGAVDGLGVKQANMVAELFTKRPKFDKNRDEVIQIVILKGQQGHQDAENRTDNCVNRLKELGFNTDVLAIEVANFNRKDAYEAMRLLYTQYGDKIELVFANNDDMALGAIDYLTDMNIFSANLNKYDQPFVIVGVDGTAVGLEAIEKGLLYGTVYNDSKQQADAIMLLAGYIVEDKSLAGFPYTITKKHYIYFDGDIIIKTNVSDYIKP